MKLLSRLVAANSIGTFLEYFDYVLYGFSVPLIASLFFPSDNPITSQLLAWCAFSVSFLIRPVGAALFGHYGDQLGRRKMLRISIVLMAISTTLLGLLPTYSQIGWLAGWLLIFCRLMQGFAISAEYNGSSIYLMEMTAQYKGLLAAISPCASGLGMIAASLLVVCFIQKTDNHASFSSIHWRIPFVIAGILMGGIGLYLRNNLPETPEFLTSKISKVLSRKPLKDVLNKYSFSFIISIILSAYTGTATYTILVFTATYLQNNLGMPASSALFITAFICLMEALFSLLFGWLTDIMENYNLMLCGAVLMSIMAVPVFNLLKDAHSLLTIVSLLSFLALCLAAFDGPVSSFLSTLFPTPYRYSGVAVSFNLGGAVIGGSAPLWLTLLISKTNNLLIPGFYLSAFAMMAALALIIYSPQLRMRILSTQIAR